MSALVFAPSAVLVVVVGVEQVVAEAAPQRVAAGAADEPVVAEVAEEDVVAVGAPLAPGDAAHERGVGVGGVRA